MNMLISISDEVAAKLKERADARGQSMPAYAASLVVDSVTKPTLEELLAPIHSDFEKSGMTEEELVDLLEKAKHEMRAERRAKNS